MPKNSNKGFALVPVLIGVLFLGLAGLAVYHYYPQNNNNLTLNQAENSEDVLAGTSSNLDLNTFMLKNLLEVSSVSEFNKKSDALMFCLAGLPYQMGDYEDGFPDNPEFSQCAFFPRAASAQTITFKKAGKTMTAKAYINVTFQALARKDRWNKYIVFVPNTGSTVELVSKYKSFKNDAGVVIMKTTPECSGNVPVSNCNLSKYISQDQAPTVLKANISVENVSYSNSNYSLKVTIVPNNDLDSDNKLVYNTFVSKGVAGTLGTSNKTNIDISKLIQCNGPCSESFSFTLAAVNSLTKFELPSSIVYSLTSNNTALPTKFNFSGSSLIRVTK